MEEEPFEVMRVRVFGPSIIALLSLGFFVALLHATRILDVTAFIDKNPGPSATLVVGIFTGLLGIWGVVTTLETNAENARRQKRWEVEEERRGVRTALTAELQVMHFNLVMRRKNMLRAGKFGFKTRPRDIASFVPASGYRALLSKIHLLNLKEVKAIVAAQAEHEALVGRSEWVEEQWRLTKREKAMGIADPLVSETAPKRD